MSRRTYLLATFGVILAGILSRVGATGYRVLDKYAGDALYAIMVYTLLSVVAVRCSPAYKFATCLLVMLAIEVFQVTHIAAGWSQRGNLLLRILARLLGTTFSWLDMLAYGIGLLLIVGVDSVGTRARRAQRSSVTTRWP